MCGIFSSSIRYLLATGCLASSTRRSVQAVKGGFLLAGAQSKSGLQIVLNMRSIIFWPAILFLITPAGAKAAEKKLIEFGWDEPDTAFMREHAAEMERSPFDGCVFQTP